MHSLYYSYTRCFMSLLSAVCALMMTSSACAGGIFSFNAKIYGADCSFDIRDSTGKPLPELGYFYALDYKSDSRQADNTYYCPINNPNGKARLAELAATVQDEEMVVLDAHVKPLRANSDEPGLANRTGIFTQCSVTTKLNTVNCAYEWPELPPRPEARPSSSQIFFGRGEILYGELRSGKTQVEPVPTPPYFKIVGCDANDEAQFPCHDVN